MKVLLSRLQTWWRSITHRRVLEEELEEELNLHLELRSADLESNGLSHAAALRQAKLELGSMATHKDGMRRSFGLRWWDDFWIDIRFALRVLRKSPGFTVIAVGSLSLALGANTAMFSMANEIMYERLGVPNPKDLRLLVLYGDKHVVINSSWGDWSPGPKGGWKFNIFAYPIYEQLRRDNQVLNDLFAFKDLGRANVTANNQAMVGEVEMVSGNLYEQMQVQPAVGRGILPSDDAVPNAGAVVVLSDGFWTRVFGRSPNVLGKTITVNAVPMMIVGVNPKQFTGAKKVQSSPDIFMPLSMVSQMKAVSGRHGQYLTSTDLWWVQVMARTRPGVSDAQATSALNVSLQAAIRSTIQFGKNETMPVLALEDGSRGLNFTSEKLGRPIYVLLAMTCFVLLLACANLANLMLARAAARQREMGVRLALGAERNRVMRQVLTESMMIAALGGVFGLVFGYAGSILLPRLTMSAWEQTATHIPFNWKIFVFAALVTCCTGVLFGIAPAWQATRAEVGTALKDGTKSATKRSRGLSGRMIVGVQVALSTLLVTGSVLFLRTLWNLYRVDPGFHSDHLVMFDINPPDKKYPKPKEVDLSVRIEQALQEVPGVENVAGTDIPLIADSSSITGFTVEGQEGVKSNDGLGGNSKLLEVGNDYFKTMGIPILAGRPFRPQDTNSSIKVTIVNRALARKFFGDANPIGHRVRRGDNKNSSNDPWMEIIGVCADTRYANMREEPPTLHYDLYRQDTGVWGLTFMIRTPMKPEAIVPSLRAAVARIDPDLPMMDIRTQQEQIDASLQQERIFASLTSGFGVLALALACVGIYGMMAYRVSQRTQEIGLRLALGAQRLQVRTMMLKEAVYLGGVGIIAGSVCAALLAQVVKTMLYGVRSADPFSLVGSATLLLAVALAAAWLPAVRASSVEPLIALRHE